MFDSARSRAMSMGMSWEVCYAVKMVLANGAKSLGKMHCWKVLAMRGFGGGRATAGRPYGAPLVTNRHNLKTVKSLKPKNQNQQPNYATTYYEIVHIIYRLLPRK